MWKILFFLAVPLVPLAAAHSGGNGGEASDAEVQCLIRAEGVGSGVQLEGVAVSKQPRAGTYEFDVRKTGRAGTSSSAQSGAFEMRRGEAVIGQVGLRLERGASYEAKLVMHWDGGEASCAALGPALETGAKR